MRDPGYLGAVAVLLAIALAAVALRLASSDASSAAVEQSAPPSTATAAPRATPSPAQATATPSYADVLSDSLRLIDLTAWHDALEAHHARTGTYPSSSGAFIAICADAADGICSLRSGDEEFRAGEGDAPHWYRSDGVSFTLATAVSAASATDDCPGDLPPDLADEPAACVSSGGGE
jgi:hypothetical protein